eukprot:TRINITY_DN3038_c0_g3_i2.p1 TRINITY_DN3038_c0_g3~~TRINITY_DN3038_c0_g3_i2.p1  ORF type:complete len:435 (+),score=178.66 TRINITY_DN3038_c0_g3_i2:482-1786(+)
MSGTVSNTLTAGEQAQVIDDGKNVGEKFNNSLLNLEIIKYTGHPSYGDEPQKRLGIMKKEDATFNTDINKELQRIELLLRQQKLEQQWRKEGRGQDMHPDEEHDAMVDWIQEQLEHGACSEVQLKLPKKKRTDLGAASVLDNKNHDYEDTLHNRKASEVKNQGDRVSFNGKHGVVQGNKDGVCAIKWDKPEEGEELTAEIPASDLVLLSKAHPGMMITASSRKTTYKPQQQRKSTSNQTSCLASLFSQYDGSSPDFLHPAADSRRAKIERIQHERKAKMMSAKGSHSVAVTAGPKPAKKNVDVQSKFMQRTYAPLSNKEVQINKEANEPLGLTFDPETLCLTDTKDGTGSALDACRGMRLTHVSTREDYSPFTNEEGVHSKEQLRKALAKATRSEIVAFRFESWTQRRAVEKKKRENREKLIATKDKNKERTQA